MALENKCVIRLSHKGFVSMTCNNSLQLNNKVTRGKSFEYLPKENALMVISTLKNAQINSQQGNAN